MSARHKTSSKISSYYHRRGLTIVETLVMVLVLALTLAVAVPLFTNAQTYSKQKACEAQMAAIFQAEEAYRTKNRSYTTNLTSTGTNPLSMNGGLPQCPLGAAAYTAVTAGSGSTQTITIQCSNAKHGTGTQRWQTSDGYTFTSY